MFPKPYFPDLNARSFAILGFFRSKGLARRFNTMLLRYIALGFVVFAISETSFSQSPVSTQTDKQKVAVVVPSSNIDDETNLIEGKVIIVYDGDHLALQTKDKKIYSIRIQGIDAPEDQQEFGKKSRKKLSDLVIDKEVKVIVHKKDLYDRYVGSVYINGQDVGLKQIENGMAWHFKRFSSEQSADSRMRYTKTEIKARGDKVGLWGEKAPMPPWEFRNEEPVESTATAKTATLAGAPEKPNAETSPATQSKPSGRSYVLGPRGGCYYLGEGGRKVYVKDKTLCSKP